jgi:hypothetical protein
LAGRRRRLGRYRIALTALARGEVARRVMAVSLVRKPPVLSLRGSARRPVDVVVAGTKSDLRAVLACRARRGCAW